MTNPFDDYLTEEKLAELLKQTTGEGSVRTLRKWRQQRKGPPWTRVGRKILYGPGGVGPWLQSLTVQPARSRRSAAA